MDCICLQLGSSLFLGHVILFMETVRWVSSKLEKDRSQKKITRYLQNGEGFAVRDALETFPVNGEDAIATLDTTVAIGHTAADHLVNLFGCNR